MNTGIPNFKDPKKSWRTKFLNEQRIRSQKGLLEWWYRIAAPIEPENSTPHEREVARAGRVSSVILLIIFCFGLSVLPSAIISANYLYLPIVLVAMAINMGVVVLNRQGRVALVGVLMVIVVESAFILLILTSPTGFTARTLTTFDLIVLTELIAVSLLPPKIVFLVALCNCLFTWGAITYLPHAPDFPAFTASTYYTAIARPLALQIIVALVTYIWVQGATQAIARAEQFAELERLMAEQDRAVAEQKQQLDQGIEMILQTQYQIANGDLNARAPLAQESVLWQVANNLNNLLSRYQRAAQSHYELQRTGEDITHLTREVRMAKKARRPIFARKNGTQLDPLTEELAGSSIQ